MLDGARNLLPALIFAMVKLKGQLLGVPELGGRTKAAFHFMDADGL